MTPEQKIQVRSNLYDKYVAPSYASSGLKLPDKNSWVSMSERNHSILGADDVNSQFVNKSTQALINAAMGLDSGLGSVAMFGLQVPNKIFQALHGMDAFFSAHAAPFNHDYSKAPNGETGTDKAQKIIDRQINQIQHHNNDVDFWLNTHFRDTKLNSIAHWTGEQIATVPIYKAVSEGIKAFEIANQTTKFGSLSRALTATTKGKVVYEGLKSATDMFLSTLVTSGGSGKEAAYAAIGGAIMGGATTKLASYSLIKKWTAKALSMGGKPFAEDLAASANHEVTAKMHMQEDVSVGKNKIKIKTKNDGSGMIIHEGNEYHYANKEEGQKLFDSFIKETNAARAQEDPLMHGLHTAEKHAQDSIAQQLYGRALGELNPRQQKRVLAKRMELINQAANEAPAHLPEEVTTEAQQQLDKEFETNPGLKARSEAIQKKYGISIAGTTAAKNGENVALETGIKDPGATTRKILAAAKESGNRTAKKKAQFALGTGKKEYEYEPQNGASAFMHYRKNTIAYLKKASNARELIKDEGLGMGETKYRTERRASDNTLVGDRDKRGWDQIVTDERRKRFVEQLKQADGGAIYFESDMHRMLFHYADKNSMSPGLKAKFMREMRAVPGYEQWTTKDFDKAADWTMLHVYELAKSGRLVNEGNVFSSTIPGVPAHWTDWQFELANENDAAAFKLITDSLGRHPEVKISVLKAVKGLASMKYKAGTVDKYIEFDKGIQEIAAHAAAEAGH